MSDPKRPHYTGLRTYKDPGGRFMFRYPKGWHAFDLEDDRDGVMYSPEVENPNTWFSAWVTELPYPVVADDIDVLREGVSEGLSRLDDLHIEFESEDTFGNLCRFKRMYTLKENGETRKRHVWMFYAYKWLIVLAAQGATPEAYQYWQVMLDGCFNSFDLANELWFATDPETMSREPASP